MSVAWTSASCSVAIWTQKVI